jgi:hypothetical protein
MVRQPVTGNGLDLQSMTHGCQRDEAQALSTNGAFNLDHRVRGACWMHSRPGEPLVTVDYVVADRLEPSVNCAN